MQCKNTEAGVNAESLPRKLGSLNQWKQGSILIYVRAPLLHVELFVGGNPLLLFVYYPTLKNNIIFERNMKRHFLLLSCPFCCHV